MRTLYYRAPDGGYHPAEDEMGELSTLRAVVNPIRESEEGSLALDIAIRFLIQRSKLYWEVRRERALLVVS